MKLKDLKNSKKNKVPSRAGFLELTPSDSKAPNGFIKDVHCLLCNEKGNPAFFDRGVCQSCYVNALDFVDTFVKSKKKIEKQVVVVRIPYKVGL